jgi:hypothetical protein
MYSNYFIFIFFAANAVCSTMAVFFPQIMEHLKVFLSGQLSPDEMPLQIQALGKKLNSAMVIH